MKLNIKYIPLLKVMLTGIAAVSVVSCTKDNGFDPVPAGERVNIEVYTSPGDYTEPVTRVKAAEFTVSATPMIIVFKGSDENAVFSEAVQAVQDGSLSTVKLTSTTDPSLLLILANIPGDAFVRGGAQFHFSETSLTAWLAGKTIKEIEQQGLLQTVKLGAGPQTTLPFASTTATLPMSTFYPMPSGIQKGDKIGTASSRIAMTRAVAKASVEVVGAGDFKLVSVGVVNAAQNGNFYRYFSTSPYSNTGNLTNYGNGLTGMAMADATGTTTEASPLYLYETRADQGTALIVVGDLNGTRYYYRVPFSSNGQLLDIERNKNYVFRITSAGQGFTTWNAAVNSTGEPPLSTQIIVTDASSYDIIANNDFYIGVSNSWVELYHNQAASSLPVTLITNAHQGVASTVSISAEGGIMFNAASISLPGSQIITSTIIYITVPAGITEGTVTILIGSLKKEIHVRRHIGMPSSGILKLQHDDYTYCEVTNGTWLKVSPDQVLTSDEMTLDAPGTVYLVGGTSGSVRTGEVFASRKTAGRTRIYVRQN